MSKILCPYHLDTNPSLHVYPNGWGICFVCHTRVYIGGANAKQVKIEPTDVKSELSRIQGLPIKRIRGLDLHAENEGSFYIIWSSEEYYKRRNTQGLARYVGPRGIKPPIFLYSGDKNHLVVIEGELNCMSIKKVYDGPETLCSPGAASQFPKFIDLYKQYKHVTLIVDNDGPGVVYGYETKEKLLKLGKRVDLITVDTDYNDTLVKLGIEGLREQFRKDTGL